MDNAALMSIDVQRGLEILNALDQAGLNVKVALWAVCPNTTIGDWWLRVPSSIPLASMTLLAFSMIRSILQDWTRRERPLF